MECLPKKMQKNINGKDFWVKNSEYNKKDHQEFCNLNILDKLGEHERIISLLQELSFCYLHQKTTSFLLNLISISITHGGYIEIQSAKNFNVIEGTTETNDDFNHLEDNKKSFDITNISIFSQEIFPQMIAAASMDYMIFIKNQKQEDLLFFFKELFFNPYSSYKPIYILFEDNNDDDSITKLPPEQRHYLSNSYQYFHLTRSNYKLFVHFNYINQFTDYFAKFIITTATPPLLDYDNLIHLTMIVKNAGDSFADVLQQNLPYFDQYTILDTGSTDNTIDIINTVLKNKKGKIYQEPFINFRDSRNRCLDLAGTDSKFLMMLDDTYIIKNNLRAFLETVRGDQFSSSFSLYIHSDDVEYGSNRIIKSASQLRYKYKIHEVITPVNNINVIVPMPHGYIYDFRSDYMETRTMDRKTYDLQILHEMVEEDPHDSRAYYYLGQTHNLLKNHAVAFENFILRVNHHDEGFIQEKIDACFEAARLANFYLQKPWEECEALYTQSYNMDRSRPDSLYFIGIHYYLEQNYSKAYDYFKEAFRIGYPVHCQYSLKPTLSYYYLPKFLAEVCYYLNDAPLGLECSQFFIDYFQMNLKNMIKETAEKRIENDLYTMKCWKKIYTELLRKKSEKNSIEIIQEEKNENEKQKIVFIVNGGFTPWTGSDIEKKGMGGSETFIIEISKFIASFSPNQFQVIVFCNCLKPEIYKDVFYYPLLQYTDYLLDTSNIIHSLIISRYPEYLPACYKENVKNVYLILHDLIPEGEIILRHTKLRKILLLSNYHLEFFNNMFPTLQDLTEKFEYGIDLERFDIKGHTGGDIDDKIKVKNRFIYSSFANRGLLYLLEMWMDIRKVLNDATLFIHCDVDNPWLNQTCKEDMDKIKSLLFDLQKNNNNGVFYKGWTSKEELSQSWKEASIWFYPTTFLETFCLTALEAAVSKTLAVTFPIGSLQETVGDRGLLINKNILSTQGRENTLGELFSIILGQTKKRDELIQRNYQWGIQKTWEKRAEDFFQLIFTNN